MSKLTHNDKDYIHYVYKITNCLNGKFYIGVHSLLKSKNIDPCEDGYWGSGTLIKFLTRTLGRQQFKKEIIFVGQTRQEIFKKEKELVDIKMLTDLRCYNLVTGGKCRKGNIPVYVGDFKKLIFLTKNELRKNPELKSNIVPLNDKPYYAYKKDTYEFFIISNETEVKNYTKDKGIQIVGKAISDGFNDFRNSSPTKGRVVVVKAGDPQRICIVMPKDDPRYLSGEYVGVAKGRHLSEEKRANRCGENNSGYNTMWITNGDLSRKIKKDDLIPDGWYPGRHLSKEKIDNNIKQLNLIRESKQREAIILNNLTNENQKFRLDSIFFSEKGELISPEKLQAIYEPLNSWVKVSNLLGLCRESVDKIKKFYISLGYQFHSSAVIRRPGRRNPNN